VTGSSPARGVNQMAQKTNFEWLQEWYFQQTNGDWEHQYGIKIETLDNPGWALEIDLDKTNLFKKNFSNVNVERSDNDWFFVQLEQGKFEISCGPFNLEEALGYFRNWAQGKA
jgi:hypothetical protein